MRQVAWCLVSVGVLSSGCTLGPFERVCEYKGAPTEVAPTPEPERVQRVAEVLPVEHDAIDILFVVDDSRSMSDEQEQLGIWSHELFDVLSLEGELPDLHIAVISSSFTVPTVAGCEFGGDGKFHIGDADLGGDQFLRDVAGPEGRVRNYQGSLRDSFAAMAKVGELGCGFEQPFAAASLALSGTLPENDGFLRDEALLVIVFVTDEDDCSATNSLLFSSERDGTICSPLGPQTGYRCFEFGVVCDDGKDMRDFGTRSNCRSNENSEYIAPAVPYAALFKGLKDHPSKVIIAGVYGKTSNVEVGEDVRFGVEGAPRLQPGCESELGSATPGIRINTLLAKFPARSAQSSICEPDLSWAMRNTALVARGVASRSHCLAGDSIDVASCSLASVTAMGSSEETVTAIPNCDGGEGERCYRIQTDLTACGDTPTQLAFSIENDEALADETLTMSCAVPTAGTIDI